MSYAGERDRTYTVLEERAGELVRASIKAREAGDHDLARELVKMSDRLWSCWDDVAADSSARALKESAERIARGVS